MHRCESESEGAEIFDLCYLHGGEIVDLSWACVSRCVSSDCQEEVFLYISFIEIFFLWT